MLYTIHLNWHWGPILSPSAFLTHLYGQYGQDNEFVVFLLQLDIELGTSGTVRLMCLPIDNILWEIFDYSDTADCYYGSYQ